MSDKKVIMNYPDGMTDEDVLEKLAQTADALKELIELEKKALSLREKMLEAFLLEIQRIKKRSK